MLPQAYSDELISLFELSRHGARAPLYKDYVDGFTVGPEELTPSGMRQHFLIGEFLRHKYIETLKFLPEEYSILDVLISSTHWARTIQSARAHMMGFYGVHKIDTILTKEDYDASFPPFNLSADYVSEPISNYPKNYFPVAVHNSDVGHDSLFQFGYCPYLQNQYDERRFNHSLFQKYDDYFRPKIYDKIKEILGLNDIPNYYEAYHLGDVILCREFEGLIDRSEFTPEEWKHIEHLQLPYLRDVFTDFGNKLMISKMFNPIYENMLMHMNSTRAPLHMEILNEKKKYILFSSHDMMLAQFIRFLNPQNIFIEYIPYATNFIFEQYKKADGKYYLKVLYNNEQVQLPFCTSLDCDFQEFSTFYLQNSFSPQEVISLCEVPSSASFHNLNKA